MKRRASGGASRLVKKRTTLPTKQRSKHVKDISNGNVTNSGMNKPKRCMTCKHFLSRAYRHRNCYRCVRRLKKAARMALSLANTVTRSIKAAEKRDAEEKQEEVIQVVGVINRTKARENKQIWILNNRVYCEHKDYADICRACATWVKKAGVI